MQKDISILLGIILVLMGIAAMIFNLGIPMLGLNLWFWGAWRLWPLLVIGLGALLVLPPLLVRGRPGLGLLFIPGLPILTTGGILLLASVFNWWAVWSWLWPQLVLSLGVGFLFAALYSRMIWLLVPAFVFGANGLLMQLCAITGLWEIWAVLWTIEPLALGLAFLVIGVKKQSAGLFLAGIILCGLAAIGLIGMTAVLALSTFWSGLWLVGLFGPTILILAGISLVAWNVIPRRQSTTQIVKRNHGTLTNT